MYTITWGSYIIFGLSALSLYYGALFSMYYRKDLTSILSKRSRTTNHKKQIAGIIKTTEQEKSLDQSLAVTTNPQLKKNDSEKILPLVHDLVDELQAYIQESGRLRISKEDLIESLKKILQKYSSIQITPFQEGIRNLIAANTDNHCAFRLSANELAELWNGETA